MTETCLLACRWLGLEFGDDSTDSEDGGGLGR